MIAGAASVLACVAGAVPACGSEIAPAERMLEISDYSLRPRIVLTTIAARRGVDTVPTRRVLAFGRRPAAGPAHEVRIGGARATRRFTPSGIGPSGTRSEPGSFMAAAVPNSRLIRYEIEDSLFLDEHLGAAFGWHGIKVTNRTPNVTAGSGEARLRARDWFLPRASLRFLPDRRLALSIGYDETLRAFGDTGLVGPMGLTEDAFRRVQRDLRPETHSRFHLRTDWTPSAALGVSMTAYAGRLDDRLSFVDRGYLPRNVGSARIRGATVTATHRLSAALRWSVRYNDAQLAVAGGRAAHERSVALEGVWSGGPWRATLGIAKDSRSALDGVRARPLRIEAGIEHVVTSLGLRPWRLSARLTDPDRLASGGFARADLSGVVHAADQARALMVRAALDW